MVEINGLAHVVLTVSKWEQCSQFYDKILSFFGMNKVFHGEEFIYFVGGRTAIGISRCKKGRDNELFNQDSIGLHHLCFRAKSREDVDKTYNYLKKLNSNIVHNPENGSWAPGYYSLLFEDPIGTRLEINYVPGTGLLKEGVIFDPTDGYK